MFAFIFAALLIAFFIFAGVTAAYAFITMMVEGTTEMVMNVKDRKEEHRWVASWDYSRWDIYIVLLISEGILYFIL